MSSSANSTVRLGSLIYWDHNYIFTVQSKIDLLLEKINWQDQSINQLNQTVDEMKTNQSMAQYLPFSIEVPSTIDLAFHISEFKQLK